MANKIDAKLILELLQTPMSQREIIKTRHISSKSITAVCRRAAELGVSYADLVDKSDDEVYLLFFPDKFQKETVYAPVNYEYVHGELKKTGVTLKLLWQEYKDGVKVVFRSDTQSSVMIMPSMSSRTTSRITLRTSRVLYVKWTGAVKRCAFTIWMMEIRCTLCISLSQHFRTASSRMLSLA